MNIKDFRTEVITYIEENYEDVNALNCDMVKNNSVKLCGITIKQREGIVFPTIYLEPYLEQYINGTPLETIVKNIMEQSENAKIDDSIDIDFFSNYERVKDKLYAKIINTNKNSELLNEIPHKHFLDLSIVVYCDMSEIIGVNATVLVRNEHVDKWGVMKDKVIEDAYENTRNREVIVKDIMEIVGAYAECVEKEDQETMFSSNGNMLVMTNDKMSFGAIGMTFDDKLDEFCCKKHKGIYIIPSSIHEVILVPDNERIDEEWLNNIIKEVNKTSLSKEEVLSENAYYYSAYDGYSIV